MNQDENIPPELRPRKLFNKIIPDFKKNKTIVPLIFLVLLVLITPLIFLTLSKTVPGISKSSQQIVAKPSVFPKARYIADELIVQYKNIYTKDELLELDKKLSEIGVISQAKLVDSDNPLFKNFYLLNFKNNTDLKKVVESLYGFKEILSFGPNFILKLESTPNDPGFSQQWDMKKISMPDAWDIAKGSKSVRVAVIDTGIDYSHQDMAGRNIIKGPDYADCYQYDPNDATKCIHKKPLDKDPIDHAGHGTHVAGTIAAVTNNKVGISGINWNVTLIAIKTIEDKETSIQHIEEGIANAIDQHANVINLSLTAPAPCNDPLVQNYQWFVKKAVDLGIVVVSAAGNEGQDVKFETPPSCSGVIVVGATDQNDKRAVWSSPQDSSNYGSRVDISAPGTGILSSVPGGYSYKNGTSMAAPHVTGAVALLLSQNGKLTPSKIKDCLVKGADSIQTDKPIGKRLNVLNALKICKGEKIPQQPKAATITNAAGNAEIRGVVFVDTNGNGKQDAGERAFTQAQIATDGVETLNTTPDSSGNFSFSNLSFGSYTVGIFINNQKVMSTQNFTLTIDQPSAVISFPLPPAIANTIINPTPTPLPPTISKSSGVKSSSSGTYTCEEATSNNAPAGAIKIGSLICFPTTSP